MTLQFEYDKDKNITPQDIKDMTRIYEDVDSLVAGEKTHCVLNVLLNMCFTQMIKGGQDDKHILKSVKKIITVLREHLEEDDGAE